MSTTFSPALQEFLAAPADARRLGPYRCEALLDQAGTAPVFRAVEEHAGRSLREVAVKVFDIGRAKGAGWQARVLEEARSLCRVQHPNVIRFHTLATDPKRGLMGLVMEFAEGISVEKQIEELPPGDARRAALAVEVGINISSALAAAHEAKLVHCNVKPSNIMFTEGTHKLINFGIAASARPTGESSETRAGLAVDDLSPDSIGERVSMLEVGGTDPDAPLVGTVGYVDPVTLRTTSVPTPASDLYSLGASLYQCLAGDVPAVASAKHRGKSGVDAQVLVGEKPATPVAELAPFAPADLAKLVDALVAPSRDGRPRSADAVRRTLERIRSALAGRARALPPASRGPFPGLAPYEASDRDVFFGRSAESAGMLELCRTRGLVGIVGRAGTGKRSLARAGVVPAIEEGALEGWPPKYRSVIVAAGGDLKGALDGALSKLLGAPLAEHPEAIAEQLAADVDDKGEGIVILVEQLEQIVTAHETSRDESRLHALDLLARIADAPAGLRVIVTARREVLDEILAIDPHFSRALSRGLEMIGPLSPTDWEEVLDHSLEAYGISFEDAELRRDVLDDLRGLEGAMPLAQFGLASLWAARDQKKNVIPRAAFEEKAGVRGALSQHAAATAAALEVPRETLRDVLLALTTPEGTRAQVKRSELVERFGPPAKTAIDAFVEARLFIEDKGSVTFAHDAILREWGLLRSYLDDARDDRLLSAHLERDAARWVESRDSAELWRKGRLAAALDLWKRGSVPMSDAARQFVTTSSREEAKARVTFWTLAALVVMLVVGGSLIYAKESRERAEQARRDADALAAALAEVKALKRQAEESAMEAAATAELIAELQKSMADERSAYGAKVKATMKKVSSATSLGNAQKEAEELSATNAPAHNQVVPLPMDLVGGPSAPKLDTSGPSPSAGGGTFDQAAIERVVATRKAGVKRSCLERSTSTASSTKITATLTVAPSGAVRNVTTTGNDPVVGKCIEQKLRTWTFPAPGETKTVQIPFVFVRQ